MIKYVKKTAIGSILSCAVLMGAATGTAYAVESVTLQMATISTPDNVWYKAAQKYAEGVASRTNGKVKIQIAHSSMTGTIRETVEGLKIGTNDIVETIISSLEPYDKLAAIESYPYLIRDEAHFDSVFHGAVGRELYDAIGKNAGFKLIGAGFRGAREMASKKPVNSVQDLAGIKMRVPEIPIFRMTWKSLGASPIPMSTKEVYTGLQEGIIDACENPLEAHMRSRYYEAAKYVVLTSHVYGAYTFIYDAERFKSFSPELQTILQEEGEKAMRWGGDQTKAEIEGFKAELRKRGVTILSPELGPFRAKTAAMANEFPDLKPWIEKISAVK